MKAIFTGTEKDLIECGFIEDKKYISPHYVIRSVDKDNVLRICVDEPIYNIWDGEDKNHSMEIWLENDKTGRGTCNFDKPLIQDLIDKNLVRFEKE